MKQILNHSVNMDTIELFCLLFLVIFLTPVQRSRLQWKIHFPYSFVKFISDMSCVFINQDTI